MNHKINIEGISKDTSIQPLAIYISKEHPMLKGIAFLLTSMMALILLAPTPTTPDTGFRFEGLPGDTDFLTAIQKESTVEDVAAIQKAATEEDVRSAQG